MGIWYVERSVGHKLILDFFLKIYIIYLYDKRVRAKIATR